MPKLLIFVSCEKVIVSEEGPISLITVLEGLNVGIPTEEYDNLPDDAVAPISWHVLAKWSREDENEDPAYWQQRIQVATPGGRISSDSITDFDLAANVGMRNILKVNGFPIKPLGRYKIMLSLRKAGDDDAAWQEIASYPISVRNDVPNPER